MLSNNWHSGIVNGEEMSDNNNYPNCVCVCVCVIQIKQQNFKQNSNIWNMI